MGVILTPWITRNGIRAFICVLPPGDNADHDELIGIFLIVVSFGAIMLSAAAPGGMKGSILLVIIGIILILLRACDHSFTLRDG